MQFKLFENGLLAILAKPEFQPEIKLMETLSSANGKYVSIDLC